LPPLVSVISGFGTSSTDGVMLYNTTAATSGSQQQYSPRRHFEGQGWKTNSTGCSGHSFGDKRQHLWRLRNECKRRNAHRHLCQQHVGVEFRLWVVRDECDDGRRHHVQC
jgi:hypothetical protein